MFASSRSNGRVLGSVRKAEPHDAIEIARLLTAANLDSDDLEDEISEQLEHSHLLVLDIEGKLGAVVDVALDQPARRARLQLLIVDAALAHRPGREVEDRMVGVALAFCEAYGCTDVDVLSTPTSGRPESWSEG